MAKIQEDLNQDELIELSLSRGEGEIAANGALLVKTGKRTGRSPLDRFIVKDLITESMVAVSYTHLTLPTNREV